MTLETTPIPFDQLVKLFAVGSAQVGSGFVVGRDRLLVQPATIVGTVVSPFGIPFLSITFPTPFPNGVFTAIAMPGDGVNRPTGATWTQSYSLSGFTIGLPGSAAGGLIRIDYIALGW